MALAAGGGLTDDGRESFPCCRQASSGGLAGPRMKLVIKGSIQLRASQQLMKLFVFSIEKCFLFVSSIQKCSLFWSFAVARRHCKENIALK